MHIGIYTPYLDSFGGGERYMLTIAEVLSEDSSVDLLLDTHLSSLNAEGLKAELSRRFNLDLSKINLISAPIGAGTNLLVRNSFLKKYDLVIALTDGSIFNSSAKRNILHIQSPLSDGIKDSYWRRLKLKSWDLVIYNSDFTKDHAQALWPIKSVVINPPVDVKNVKPLAKKKKILSVGRFFGFLRDKKQGILIDAFADLSKRESFKGWSLNLAGSASEGDMEYIQELRKQAAGLEVNFFPNIPYKELNMLYGESSVYWHASGFNETDPSKMEHFGITTVEAMAGGCVPIVISLGGQKDIVEDGKSGFLWNSIDQLKEKTEMVITDKALFKELSAGAISRSKYFSKENFSEKIRGVVYENDPS